MIGQTISHYRILDKLGEGGMGVVYKAEDLRLKRTVALKFLVPQAVGDEDEKARLVNEAQAAASLDHPNICTVFEIDDVDGQTFIAMAYVEGHTVKERVRGGTLTLNDSLDLAIQVGKALHEAHLKGVIHRDIKSANIMVTEKGQAKIMDFGLAQLSGQTKITKTGTTVGTPAYMSPEQARGDTIDPRADIWSLAVVLFEMVTGKLPFKRGSELAVLYAILNEHPPLLSSLSTGIPASLDRIVQKALRKPPTERYYTAAEMAADLEAVRKEFESGTPTTQSRDASPLLGPAIAVLPFTDMSPEKDQEYFCEGMAEEVINALAQVEGLRVVSRSSSFQFKGKSQDIREVGEKLRVGVVLEGSVRRAGSRLRITTQLVSVADGFQIWSERFDREMKDVFDIQDEISLAIVSALKIKLVGDQPQPLIKRYTDNIEAYHLYLKGRYYWNQRVAGSIRRAMEFFQQALAQDPDYAPAWAGIADCFIVPGYYHAAPPVEVYPKGREAAKRALELDPQVAEAHASLGALAALYEYEWAKSESHFRRSQELNPSYANAPMWNALFALSPVRRLDEALQQARHSRDLDPLSPAPSSSVGIIAYFQRNYDRSIRELVQTLELDGNFGMAFYWLGKVFEMTGRHDRAIENFEKAREALNNNPGVIGALGHCLARAGRDQEARAALEAVQQAANERHVPATAQAFVYLGLDEPDAAFHWLEKACEDYSSTVIWLKTDPVFDPLHSDPRFAGLLRKLRL
jgi:serine/threonine protein kinase/Tfp pilus assembly protein PilF